MAHRARAQRSFVASRPPARPSRVQRVLNSRLLFATLVAIVVLMPAIYFWHAYQVRRTAKAFLERADALAQEEKWGEAASYLFRYLQLHPEDAAAKIRLAETYDRSAQALPQKPRAIDYYYQALGVAAPDAQIPLRRRLSELLLEVERFASAEEQANELLAVDANDRQANRVLAMALHGQLRHGSLKPGEKRAAGTGDILERAFHLNPSDTELAGILAEVYRNEPRLLAKSKQKLTEEQRKQAADRFIDQCVAADPQNPQVHLLRHRYRVKYGLAGAKDDLAAALRLGPEDVRVLLVAAEDARREASQAAASPGPPVPAGKRYEKARQYYERAIKAAATDERGYVGLGEIYALEDQLDRAIATWELGLEKSNRQSIPLNSHLAEALIAQGKLDRAAKVLEVLDNVVARIRQQEMAPLAVLLSGSVDLLRAKFLLRKGDRRNAAPLLRRVAAGQTGSPWEVRQVFEARMLLGRVEAAEERWDLAATAFEQATGLEPKLPAPLLAAANAWMAADRPEISVGLYERALAIDNQPETWLLLARARLRVQARLPKADRNWEAFHKAIAEARGPKGKGPLADPWRVNLLEADYIALEGEQRERPGVERRGAVDLLRAAEKDAPDSAPLMAGLIVSYERTGNRADADRVLERFGKLAGSAANACLLRARLASGRKQYDEARKTLREGLAKLNGDARRPLEAALVQISLDQGRPEQALEELKKLCQADSPDVTLVRQLMELASDLGKWAEAETWESKLRELEGEDGSVWRFCRARRLLGQATGPKDPRYAEADQLQTELRRLRPAWPAAHLLSGQVLERRGSLPEAVDAYQEAIRLGEQRLVVYERLILLLYQLRRFAQADKYLAQLTDRSAAVPSLSSLEIGSAARLGQTERALELARRGAQSRPKDPQAQLWLGQMLLASEQPEQAEAAFRRAVELAPSDAQTYMALVTYYARTNKLDRARQTLAEFAKNVKASDADKALLTARGYEVIGDREKAETSYREAARLAPDSAAAQERLANHLLRSNPAEAKAALRRAIQLDPRSASARRTLATLLVEQGGEQEWQEAQRLLDPSDAAAETSVPNRRLQAVLLVRRGGKENLAKARQLLEGLVAGSKTVADGDRLLLAQVYEYDGKLPAADKELLALAGRTDPEPEHLAAYVDFWLRHNEPNKTTAWLERLEKATPDSLAVLRLRARWLQAQGRDTEIGPFVEKAAEKAYQDLGKNSPQNPEKQAAFCLGIADLYSAVKQHWAAEGWCRRAVKLSPERYAPLALCLARQGRAEEGTRLCLEASKSDPSARPAMALATILVQGRPSAKDFQQAEPLLSKAASQHKDDVALLNAIATVRVAQNRTDEACALLRQIVESQPKDILALNNLATLLAEQPGKENEALQYIDRAIGIVGPQPGLLDTKGTTLLMLGKPKEAAELLGLAAAARDADPRYLLHLAVAYDRLGEVGKAREAFARARHGNLAGYVLTETDRRLLSELEAKFRP